MNEHKLKKFKLYRTPITPITNDISKAIFLVFYGNTIKEGPSKGKFMHVAHINVGLETTDEAVEEKIRSRIQDLKHYYANHGDINEIDWEPEEVDLFKRIYDFFN